MRRTVEVPDYEVHGEVRVDPAKTALVIVDMQNDFVKEGGSLVVPDAEDTIPAVQGLLGLARGSSMRVIFTQDTTCGGGPRVGHLARARPGGHVGVGDRRRALAARGRADHPQDPLRCLLRDAPGSLPALLGRRHPDHLRHGGQHLRPLHRRERRHALVQGGSSEGRYLRPRPVRPGVLPEADRVPVQRHHHRKRRHKDRTGGRAGLSEQDRRGRRRGTRARLNPTIALRRGSVVVGSVQSPRTCSARRTTRPRQVAATPPAIRKTSAPGSSLNEEPCS